MVLAATRSEVARFQLTDLVGIALFEPEHTDGPPEQTSCVLVVRGNAYRITIEDTEANQFGESPFP